MSFASTVIIEYNSLRRGFQTQQDLATERKSRSKRFRLSKHQFDHPRFDWETLSDCDLEDINLAVAALRNVGIAGVRGIHASQNNLD
jgi:hypothetical protein